MSNDPDNSFLDKLGGVTMLHVGLKYWGRIFVSGMILLIRVG